MRWESSSLSLKELLQISSHSGFHGFVEIILDHTKDESTDFGEELSVMPEEHSQALKYGQSSSLAACDNGQSQ